MYRFLHGKDVFDLLSVNSPSLKSKKAISRRYRSESVGSKPEYGTLGRRNTKESIFEDGEGWSGHQVDSQSDSDSDEDQERHISFEEFARLGFVLGIPEEYILVRLTNEYGVNIFEATFDFEMFQCRYFDILSQVQSYQKRLASGELNSGVGPGDEGEDGEGRCLIS